MSYKTDELLLPELRMTGGETRVFTFAISDINGNSYDAANLRGRFTLQSPNSTKEPVCRKSMTIGTNSDGRSTVTVSLSPNDTIDCCGKYIYQLTISHANGIDIPGHGEIYIAKNIDQQFISSYMSDSAGSECDTSDATLSRSSQLLQGITAYSKGVKYTGSLTKKDGSSITVVDNIIVIPQGYYVFDEDIEREIGTSYPAGSYTPTTSDQVIPAGSYLVGNQVIRGDPHLVPGNIRAGVDIFNVVGSFSGSGAGTGSLQEKTVMPNDQTQIVVADDGYDGLSKVTVNAVLPGDAGVPVAEKGQVTNHSVTIRPRVTNAAGYISGGSKVGEPVIVTARELVSGSKTITADGDNIDVAEYETINVHTGSSFVTQSKTVDPSMSEQTIVPDEGYDGLSSVIVHAMQVGSGGYQIVVHAPAGSTVTASKGGVGYPGTESPSGTYTISVPSTGTYSLSAVKGTNSDTSSVVVSDTTAVLSYTSKTLNNASWAEISAASQAGIAEYLWDVGDCKEVTLKGTCGTLSLNTSLYVYILGFNHNASLEGNGISFGGFKASLSGGASVCLVDGSYGGSSSSNGSKRFNMNHWGSSITVDNLTVAGYLGGWKGCDLRYDILGSSNVAPSGYGSALTTGRKGYDAPSDTATNPVSNSLMSCFPNALRTVMRPMTKYTAAIGSNGDVLSSIESSVDYLALMSEFEVFGGIYYSNPIEVQYQRRYDYFAEGNSISHYTYNDASALAVTRLRSPKDQSTTSYTCAIKGTATPLPNAYATGMDYGLAVVFLV